MYDAWKMRRVDNATVYTTDLMHKTGARNLILLTFRSGDNWEGVGSTDPTIFRILFGFARKM